MNCSALCVPLTLYIPAHMFWYAWLMVISFPRGRAKQRTPQKVNTFVKHLNIVIIRSAKGRTLTPTVKSSDTTFNLKVFSDYFFLMLEASKIQ